MIFAVPIAFLVLVLLGHDLYSRGYVNGFEEAVSIAAEKRKES